MPGFTSCVLAQPIHSSKSVMWTALLLGLLASATAIPPRPCDIYSSANTPCIAAHSTTRAMYAEYNESLYQLKRSDGALKDIHVDAAGYADAGAQEAFCSRVKSCVIETIYDQSPMKNDLRPAPASTGS